MGKKKLASKAPPEIAADAPSKKGRKNANGRGEPPPGTPRSTSAAAEECAVDQESTGAAFPVVGIGASAGGLEAFTQLLRALPSDTGMGFVLIQHLDPMHESILTALLSKTTKMSITEVITGISVEQNRIYVIPPNTTMTIVNGALRLVPRVETSGLHRPIDVFLRSLAEDRKSQAIGVILSGTAFDGALGCQAIKAEGGITFAQDERSAKFDSMPRTAIATGCIDFILPPDRIASELSEIGRHRYVTPAKTAETAALPGQLGDHLHKIFTLLWTVTGIDFTHYRRTTLERRIWRRMALHKIDRPENYLQVLQGNHAEVEALYQDILINVTTFFRESEAFEVLQSNVFPELIKNRSPDQPIRIWVTGCSTGEEAYSIAIVLLEFLGDKGASIPIQIFATDISETALQKARAGIYSENATSVISGERLRRFFVKANGGYQIVQPVRDLCVYAKQNLIKDPPFSHLDLISCRNLLIYLETVLQKKVLPIFHYALKPSGFLLLGTSESAAAADLFDLVDKKHKIYSKKVAAVRQHFDFGPHPSAIEKMDAGERTSNARAAVSSELDVQKEVGRLIMAKYAVAGVLINESIQILQFCGDMSPYLAPASGAPSFNLLNMVPEGLRLELHTAIHTAMKSKVPVRKESLQAQHKGQSMEVHVEVIPSKALRSGESYFLVLFEDATAPASPPSKKPHPKEVKRSQPPPKAGSPSVAKLEQELATIKAYLQSTIEEHEAANEELKSANEEVLSTNEELQSINEELETAKEELQSTNEELTTLNEEMQNRNLELGQLNSDLVNLHSSLNVPIVVLGSDLRIRRFTSMAEKSLNLIPTDVGRPISNIKTGLNVPNLEELISEAIDTVSPKELEVQDREGRWHLLRIRPYKTLEKKIEGAVLVMIDIDSIKEARDYAEAIVETVVDPLLVLDEHLRVQSANQSFYETFQVSIEEAKNCTLYDLGNRQWDIPKLRKLLEEIPPKNSYLRDFEVSHDFQTIGHKTMLLNARRISWGKDRAERILLSIKDITERRRAEEENLHLAAIVESSSDAIIGETLEGTIATWNRGAEIIYGYSADEVIGKPMSILAPADRIDEAPVMLETVRQAEKAGYYETVHLRKDGQKIHVSITKSPIKNESGAVTGASTIATDITGRKESEEQYRVLNEVLKTKLGEVELLNSVMMDREERIIELKKELEGLKTQVQPSKTQANSG